MVLASLLLAGCGALIRPILPTPTPGPSPTPVPTRIQPTITPTVEVLILPTPLPPTSEPPTPTPEIAWLPGEVHVYPGPLHYAGDVLSIEIEIANANRLPDESDLRLLLDGDQEINVDPFTADSPLRNTVLVYRWAWDTSGEEGLHQLTLEIVSGGEVADSLDFYVEILPAEQRPPHEAGSMWQELETGCCLIHYITGTAADRDIEQIEDRAEASIEAVEAVFGSDLEVLFPITLIDNVWGNGAYAAEDIVVSYVDRAYVSIDLDSVLRHEATHYATYELGTDTPIMLVEGIAVYVSGGHYKPEPIPERAAALLPLGAYIPLADLADNFRARQHEIAYLEAAGLIAYLVEQHGWESFLELYALEFDGSPSEWLDQGFQHIYDMSLEEVEAGFLEWLEVQDLEHQAEDLRLTIALFDTIRRYQLLYAHYQEALPAFPEAASRDMTAEFVREPTSPENIALEAMFMEARESLEDGRYADAEALIEQVEAVLDTGDFSQPPIAGYLAIARLVAEAGYEAQDIDLAGEEAVVVAIPLADWPQLETLSLAMSGGGWQLAAAE